eukprot:CAMPEP_0172758832 /NCGR_PEP_ID=MMETSP1074-20121228/166513_1 /TAXON_ID=2916 /ORGANISM="Ceratium fusus, Strain PA161109" /LENGTH=69 /DNA_ID=CAMNT_0013592485 /DNA_START=375 /DNA_END=584 /DNA_ORIENTATION=-
MNLGNRAVPLAYVAAAAQTPHMQLHLVKVLELAHGIFSHKRSEVPNSRPLPRGAAETPAQRVPELLELT